MEGLLGLLLLAAAVLVLVALHRPRHPGPGCGRPVATSSVPRATDPGPPAGERVPTGERVPAGEPPPRPRPRGDDLLRYGGPGCAGVPHHGGYAALGILTTGYAPMKDTIVELAVVRTDPAGAPLETFTTLIRPHDGEAVTDTLGTIDPEELLAAPTFAQLAPTLLALLSGVVVVTHHGGHAGSFLAARFLRAGILPDPMPALSLDRFGPSLFGTPNLRAPTLARRLGVAHPLPATAADQARLAAACLAALLARPGKPLRYPRAPVAADRHVVVGAASTMPMTGAGVDGGRRRTPPVTVTPQPFLSELLAQAPISAQELNDPRVAAYLEDVAAMLAQGRLVHDELGELARRMARAGTSGQELRAISARFAESLREAVFGRPSPAPTELRQLRAAAASLGIPGYFDDLVPLPAPRAPEPGSGSFARPARRPPPPRPPVRLPRCGNCLRVGHSTVVCPMPAAGPALGIGPLEPPGRVGPIRPIGPA